MLNHPDHTDEDGKLMGFHIMAKPTGPLCNLSCTYCFYLEKEKLFPARSSWTMPYDILESFIRQMIGAQSAPTITFAWQGGEPTLLGADYFHKIVEIQRRYADGKHIENTFQTNGVLLNDEWCAFFAENKFLVGISIDGPEEIHDRHRVNRAGKPSFNDVIRGLGYLKKHGVEFNTLTAVHRRNSYHPLEVYRFLKDIGSRFMQFIPIVERVAATPTVEGLRLVESLCTDEAEVTDWSLDAMQYGNFLCAVFDEWVRNDVGAYYVQLFDASLEAWAGLQPGICVFRETCGDAMALEHNGDLYSCDHYVYPDYRIGNIMDCSLETLVNAPQQRTFGLNKRDRLLRYCLNCDVRFACNGECPKHRFVRTPDGEYGLNYLCPAYKMFFKHIAPCMKMMVDELRNERPPANVMEWVREKDKGFPALKTERNAPCPCGSGMKFKKCCGKAR
ncbi:MAG: anaerobic sulfatase-maturation protein [bacterium]